MDHLFRLIYSRNHRSSREAPDVFRMPSPPRTPSRRRRSSDIDPVSTLATPQRKDISPQAYTANPYQLSSSRRTSLYSLPSPLTPGQTSSHDHRNSLETINGLYSTVDQVNGIGNLADELAEAWDEEDELELDDGGSPAQSEGPRSPHGEHTKSSEESQFSHRDSVSLDSKHSSFSSAHWKRSLDSTRKKRSLQKHRRKHSPYGISDYSDESDFDDEMSISPSLETQMATIESLVRQGTESGCSETGGVIQRVADKLRDMSSQLSLEDSATRLITTQTTLTTNITHQTRILQNLSHPIFSPLAPPHNRDITDPLVPMMSSLATVFPTPDPEPLSVFLHLRSSTTDLLSTFSGLSDTLHVTRQTMAAASRKLKAAKDMVEDLKKDANARDEAIKWIENGQWQDRLARKECANVCRDILEGFEEVCKGYRERLVGAMVAAGGEAVTEDNEAAVTRLDVSAE